MRVSKIYPVYTIEEKNKIVEEYLSGTTGRANIIRKYDISSESVLSRWIKQYRETGSTYDNRGKSAKGKGKYKREKQIKPEDMSRDELLEYVKAVEDIKKHMAFLKKQKKNIK